MAQTLPTFSDFGSGIDATVAGLGSLFLPGPPDQQPLFQNLGGGIDQFFNPSQPRAGRSPGLDNRRFEGRKGPAVPGPEVPFANDPFGTTQSDFLDINAFDFGQITDPTLNAGLRDLFEILNAGSRSNSAAIGDATSVLNDLFLGGGQRGGLRKGEQGGILGQISGAIADLQSNVPDEVISDAELSRQQRFAFDQIFGNTGASRDVFSQSQTSRGLSGSGEGASQSAQRQGIAAGQRGIAANQLFINQQDRNATQANAKQALLNPLTELQSSLGGRFAGARAGLESADVFDPTLFASIFGDVLSGQVALDQAVLDREQNIKLAQAGQPPLESIIFDTIGNSLLAKGNPLLSAGAQGFSDLTRFFNTNDALQGF